MWAQPCFLPCWIPLLLLALLFLEGISVILGAEIRRLSIPRWVQNGTSEGVVLDCDYVYNENDLRLVVKWFFNDDLEPLYQWIPELNVRHVSGLLYGRLDMDFSVNPFDPYSQYRALRIRTASSELSGRYTCLVTSMAGQDSRQQDMTIYVPAKNFKFNSKTGTEGQLTITCSADGVFPEPRMQLYMVSHKKKTKSPTEAFTLVKQLNSTFDVILNKTLSERALAAGGVTVLECLLEIPGSPYRKAKRITYFSAGARGQDWTSIKSEGIKMSSLTSILVTVIFYWTFYNNFL